MRTIRRVLLIGGDRAAEERLQGLLQRKCDEVKRAIQIDVVPEQDALHVYGARRDRAQLWPAHCAEEVYAEPRYHALVVHAALGFGPEAVILAMLAASRDVRHWDGAEQFAPITLE